MHQNQRVVHYLDEVASTAPAPGGGSALALAAALAVSLSLKVARFSVRKAQSKRRFSLQQAIRALSAVRRQMLHLVDEDSRAYLNYRKARMAWRAHPGPRQRKRYDGALLRSFRAPFDLAQTIVAAHCYNQRVRRLSKGSIVGDLDVGDALSRAALHSALRMAVLNAELVASKKKRTVILKKLRELKKRWAG